MCTLDSGNLLIYSNILTFRFLITSDADLEVLKEEPLDLINSADGRSYSKDSSS